MTLESIFGSQWKRVGIAIFLVIVVQTTLVGQNFSKVNTPSLPILTNAKTQWVDVNNDGLLDLFISGVTDGGTLQTSVFTSNGNATFNTIGLTALADIAFDFGDYNNDGYVDIITSGVAVGGQKKTLIYRNTSGTGFATESFPIAPLSRGGLLWKDLDNDGDLDILISGLNSSNDEKINAYEYKAGNYTLRTTSLPMVSNGQLSYFDAQRDGSPEIMLTGLAEDGSPVTQIFSVNRDFDFEIYSNTLDGTAFNTIVAGDLDSDGYEDLVITGLTGGALAKKTNVLRNNTTSGFTSMNTSLVNLSSSSADGGDLDNDGAFDLVLTGQDNASPLEFKHFRYYRNNSAYSFTDVSHSMKNIFSGDASLGDYDNDGDLDIFQIGNSDISFESNLYISDQAATVTNAAPGAPTNLQAVSQGSSVKLTWDRPSDDHTNALSLSYNLYVSKNTSGSNLIVSPMANLTSGFRRIPQGGNNSTAKEKTFTNLPEGRYYWSVQAIDNGYKGSGFSSEQSFAICHDISLGADTTLCYGNQLDLSMGDVTDVVNWYSKTDGPLLSASNTFSLAVTRNDTIVVELTKSYGCTVKDTLYVTMAPLPIIDLGVDVNICSGKIFTRTLTAYDSVNWFDANGLVIKNSLTYSYTALEEETITVQVFSDHRCVKTDEIIVHVLDLPQFSIGVDQQICAKEDVTLTATGTWPTVMWRRLVGSTQAPNSTSFSYQVLQKDTVVAKVIDGLGCISYDSAIVDVRALPAVNLGIDRSVCFEENTVLQLPASTNTINWYDQNTGLLASNTDQYSYAVQATRTLVAEVIDNYNCVNYDSIQINVIALPQFDLGSPKSICYQTDTLLETGSGFQRVDWFSKIHNTVLQADSWFFNYTVLETDTLIARVESVHGCINYDSVKITMLDLPVFSLGDDLSICERENVDLSIPGNWQKVNWYTTNDIALELDSPSLSFGLENSLPVTAEVFHQNGCVQYDTVNIAMQALPVFDLGTDRTYCTGDAVSMNVGNIGTTYRWEDSNDAVLGSMSQYNFTASASRKIFLTVSTIGSCEYRDSVNIAVNALPEFSIQSPSAVCSGDKAALQVNFPWQSIVWHRAPVDTLAKDVTLLNVPVFQVTEIFATLTDINQCVSTKSVTIQVNVPPVATAGDNQLLCFGESGTLGGTYANESDLTFNWTPAQSLNSPASARPIASPQASTYFVVKVTDLKGCWSKDTVYVEVNPEIQVDAGNNTSICIGDEVTIGGSPTASGSNFPYTYQWTSNTGEITSATPTVVVTPQQTTIYSVFVSTGKCEVVYDSIVVTVNSLPEISVTSNQSIGAGGNIQLSASGAVDYVWSPAESLDDNTTDSPVAFPEVTTTYHVVGTDANGCLDSAQVIVLVQNNLFIPNLFTPNGDGSNDTFKLFGSGVAEIFFSVFDQEGNRVYHTESVSEAFDVGWDGTAKGKALKNDIYFWTLDGRFFNGRTVRYQGKSSGIIKLMK